MAVIFLIMQFQSLFTVSTVSAWSVSLSTSWDVLGPFPQSAREQQYLSPSFPLDLSQLPDFNKSWPSSYADGGMVSWSTAQAGQDGNLQISFPNIRWDNLRPTEGWAALQHHALLRTTFTVSPSSDTSSAPPTHVLVNLIQGSYFTVVPPADNPSRANFTPRWHAGNIYALPRVAPRFVALPFASSASQPTTYELWISGDYEIRLFGQSPNPTQSLTINVTLPEQPAAKHISERDVIPDFVGGIPSGTAVGVALQNTDTHSWMTVTNITSDNTLGLSLLRENTTIAPTQTRLIPVSIDSPTSPFHQSSLNFSLTVQFNDTSAKIPISIPINQLSLNGSDISALSTLKGTHFYASSMPSPFLVIPPTSIKDANASRPAILALHGAGVDILTSTEWTDALPRNNNSWYVVPTGRTSWGLDWHGPSALSSFAAVDATKDILEASQWGSLDPSKVFLMGHSNGGQGTWYIAERWPDRIIGAVPAAAYIKSQQYVPLTLSKSAHFIDPALQAILDTSLTPDNDDLFVTNLVDTPVLAVHGGIDDNVPTWHSREAVSLLKAWYPDADVTLKEDPGQLHFYDGVLDNEQVRAFVDRVLDAPRDDWHSFTLTVSLPHETGSLHGLRVRELVIPGRLGRLRVNKVGPSEGVIMTMNVRRFSLDRNNSKLDGFTVDGSDFRDLWTGGSDTLNFEREDSGGWQSVSSDDASVAQPRSRIQAVLSTSAPFSIVIDDENPDSLYAALRIAQDLDVYHDLDSEIVKSSDALVKESFSGNVLLVGDSAFGRKLLSQGKTAFKWSDRDGLSINGHHLNEGSLGVIFSHPHPSASTNGMALFVLANNQAALERALRLFPIRTGVTVPDWVITTPGADRMGTAGFMGAGVWNREWGYNAIMSWLS